jgi:hypothetical protein
MTIKELIKKLQEYNTDAEVMVNHEISNIQQ